MAKEQNGNGKTGNGHMPEGFKRLGGDFPPFVYPEVGDIVHGTLKQVRVETEEITRKVKGKIVRDEKEKTYIVFTLLQSLDAKRTLSDSDKHHYEAGTDVTFSSAAVIETAIRRAALDVAGKDPKEGEATEKDYENLYGTEFWIKRTADGEKSKGEFKGNKMKLFEIGWKPKETETSTV